ncbi:MAG: VWA domain-containing protein [Lachnospira sp.]
MKRKILAWLLAVTIIVTTCLQTSLAFANEGEENFNSTITALSSDEDSFLIETGAGCVNGNLISGNTISTKNLNVNGSITENADIKTPILFDSIEDKYFKDYKCISTSEEVYKKGNNINEAVKIENKLELDCGLNLNGALETKGDLTVNGSAFNANNALIASETGNVTLKCDNISFSGLIYLPYGTLTIEADNINLNNVCIIANKISIKSKNNLNINESKELMNFVRENAIYDDNKEFIFAEGRIDDTKLIIKWYTNVDTDEFNIYKSIDDSDYLLLANIKNEIQYICELSNDFTEEYYYVEAGKHKSVSFKVINNNGKYTVEYQDSDDDGIPDGIEEIYGTNVFEKDSDGDGLTDYEEVMVVGLNPLKKDTNGNGIDDFNDDIDKDGLSNGYEVAIGTNASYNDTDMDGVTDYDEVTSYKTDPTKKDTDGDNAGDGWELANNTNPLVKDSGFSISSTTGDVNEYDPVGASVYIDCAKADPESLTIDRVMPSDNWYISPMVAGYLGDGFDFTLEGTFDEAKLVYTYDESLGEISDEFQPRIYYFNEETKMYEELADQIVENGKVTATTTHFSTYVLLNKVEFDKVWSNNIKAAAGENSLNVALVVDLSGSMGGSKLSTAKTVINSFVDELEEKDSSALISFTSSATLRCGFTEDKNIIKKAVNNMIAYGKTSIYTGIEKALDEFDANQINGYKMMVVFTDEYDQPYTTYESNYKNLVERAKQSGVTIYTIGIGITDQNLLTNVAQNACGSFYHANVISDLKGELDKVREDAVDLVTDSNEDGISDYYTEKIKNGEIVLSNGSKELSGIDFNVNASDKASDDWDGDGLKNGQEIKVVTRGAQTYIEMTSNPLMKHSDYDAVDDYTEVKRGSDPMKYSILKSPADSLMKSSLYAYESYADDMRYGTYTSFGIGYSAVISGVWNKHELYRDVIINYYADTVNNENIKNSELIEAKKTFTDIAFQLLSYVVNITDEYANKCYVLSTDINAAISAINGCVKSKEIDALYNTRLTNVILEFNKLEEARQQLATFACRAEEYIPKYWSAEKVGTIVEGSTEFLTDVFHAIVIWTSAEDFVDTAVSLYKVNANSKVFEENMDALNSLSSNKYISTDIKNAAADVVELLGDEYEKVVINNLGRDIPEYVLNIGINVFLLDIPYINIVVAVRDILLVTTGVKEDVEQMYRMFCYSEIVYTYKTLLFSKTSEEGNYYNVNEATNDVQCIRYLTNLGLLRIVGEKEQYYFYKNDGLFKGMVNKLNHTDEVKNNTNGTIDKVINNLSKLIISLSSYNTEKV